MDRRETGERIKKLLKEKEITQVEAARITGVKASVVSEMLSGKRNPLQLAKRLAEHYDMELSLLVPDNASSITKPRLPVSASAGSLSEYVEGVMRHHCEEMPIVRSFPSYDFTMMIHGNSMEPKYESGDEIALKRATFVEWGKEYVLDTSDGPVFKRIYDAGDNIRCVSYNNKEYPDFLIPKDLIYGYYKAVGMLRL